MQDFVPLTEEETALCFKAAEIINSERPIKCTECSYCTENCPQSIQIPTYFKMYNRLKQATSAGTISRAHTAYDDFLLSNAGPSACLECGQCENACPQHLPVIKYLKDVAGTFEK